MNIRKGLKHIFSRWTWVFSIFLLGITILFGLRIAASDQSASWYVETIYTPINDITQYASHFTDAPLFWVIMAILFIGVVAWFVGLTDSSPKFKWLTILMDVLSFLFVMISLFYWIWGFNYFKKPLVSTYFENDLITLDSASFVHLWKRQTNTVNYLRRTATEPDSTRTWAFIYSPHLLESAKHILPSFGIDTVLNPRCKPLKPNGFLLRLNTAGFYFPFGSESYIDPKLHPSQYPFVVAHELIHGMGVTDEGDANFLGYLTCLNSKERYIKYAAELNLWLYMASDGRKFSKEFQKKMWDGLSEKVKKDLKERQALDQKYPAFMPKVRDFIYGSYLSFNQVEGGLKSYSRFVQMVATYHQRKK